MLKLKVPGVGVGVGVLQLVQLPAPPHADSTAALSTDNAKLRKVVFVKKFILGSLLKLIVIYAIFIKY